MEKIHTILKRQGWNNKSVDELLALSMEFKYVGYIAETPLDKEKLIVHVLDGTSLERTSVYRENGIITDDYMNLLVKEHIRN